MTLFETETILEDLSKRHPNLNKDLLTTILTASGWEEGAIQDAVLLLGERQKKIQEGASATVAPPKVVSQSVPPSPTDTTHKELAQEPTLGLVGDQLPSPVTVADVPTTAPPVESPSTLKKIQTFEQDGGLVVTPLPVTKITPHGETSLPQKVPEKVAPTTPKPQSVSVPTSHVPKEISSVPAEMTFYKHDGEEEGELTVYPDVVVEGKKPSPSSAPSREVVVPETVLPSQKEVVIPQEQSKDQPKEVVVPPVQPAIEPSPSPQEPESLIVHEEQKLAGTTQRVPVLAPIPDNLPLLPFESSPHVWSFSRYKNVFHSEPKQPEVPQVTPRTVTPVFNETAKIVLPSPLPKIEVPPQPPQQDSYSGKGGEELSVEKVPLTKGDESLVFLAGVMLLVIILILGYMYSNGRL
jgi:hypothetical protein